MKKISFNLKINVIITGGSGFWEVKSLKRFLGEKANVCI